MKHNPDPKLYEEISFLNKTVFRGKTTKKNLKLIHFANKFQDDPRCTLIAKGAKRAMIPMEINGKVRLLCPDTGVQIALPVEVIERAIQ